MTKQTVSTILTILLAGIAGYLVGGLHVAAVYCLLAGSAIAWKTAA